MIKDTIPLDPNELPQQRINEVIDLPSRPIPFDSKVGYFEIPPGYKMVKPPQSADFLGQVEWAWSPAHGRIESYYIHSGRKHWILWSSYYDENEYKWAFSPVGYVDKKQSDLFSAAVHLLIDYWKMEMKDQTLDHFHWINREGLFEAEEWRAIGRALWRDACDDD